ncbi:MAG: Nramp family divalent metal transporter [Bryobacterales bacterium]|nr:Nramp family divalent metal transporter [Bryobacterales bacterium]
MKVAPATAKDPYALDPADIESPPERLWPILRRSGPGMILCAAIVGSGELIATTALGAQVGYTALWVILLSCFVKPVVQAEMGRYTIATGETALAAFDRVPGPRWRVNWIVWAWAVMVAITLFQVGAMYAGVSQVMHSLLPAVPLNAWVVSLLVLTLALLLGGGYQRIERLAMVKVGLFTMLTVLAAALMTRMPQYFSWRQVLGGLRFRLPPGGLTRAVGVFGITGVGATEFFMYPYWCVEKGYARFTGRCDGTRSWRSRALGWIRVMQVDIFASMLIYTLATIAFYLLGAGILNGMGLRPAADQMIAVLSNMYTETLGGWALWVFYAGAIATLYGTVFAATAAHSRLYADMVRLMGFFPAGDYGARLRWRCRFVWLLTIVPALLYWLFREPVGMVFVGGLAQFLMMPVIAGGTLYLRHRRLPREVKSSPTTTVAVWCASVAIGALMVYYAIRQLGQIV